MSFTSHSRRRSRAFSASTRGAAALTFAALSLVGCVVPTPNATQAPDAVKPASRPRAKSLPVQTSVEFANPTGHGLRGADAYGTGDYGASRARGTRRHRGADYIAEAGEAVFAPISGAVTRIGRAYRGDTRFQFIELQDDAQERTVRVLYVGPSVTLGTVVRAGEQIGHAQDLTERYTRGITNHVHIEFAQSGRLTDPSALLPTGGEHHSADIALGKAA